MIKAIMHGYLKATLNIIYQPLNEGGKNAKTDYSL